ncbi:uncharacterized protein LOC106878459 [Octopus bimaculoides]|nr:uncharacterized protein LOC106878459 [Octopus bimaculoides]|eukprot:XP_014783160.1 PREDICTED: uncharacterized protein LOC106878459 [Octopus bimaculoides]
MKQRTCRRRRSIESAAPSSGHKPCTYITEKQYNVVRTCSGVLAAPCKKILQAFNINWSQTKWSDLMKPLYSGLATYLYLQLRGKPIAGDVTSQESVWRHYFHPGATSNNKFREAASRVSVSCEKPTDLVFLLDESGSVGQANYNKVKQFLEKSIIRLPISPSQFRVSVTTFSNSAKVLFYLNAFTSKNPMIQKIRSMGYNGGGTETSTGINAVVNDVFSLNNGAKLMKDAPRVLVLVTDGQSNNRAQTVAAANIAKQQGIEIFSVGVGSNVDNDELLQVAETCSRVFSLATFDDMDNFLHELIKNACGAKSTIEIPDIPSNSTNSTIKDTEIKRNVPENGTNIGVKVSPKGNGTTIVVETNCSVVKIFGSYNDSNPSESVFEITGTAADGRPMVLFVKADKHGRPLYLTFEASKVNTSQKFCFNESNFHVKFHKGKPKVSQVVCIENGVIRNCTVVDIITSKWSNKLCPPTDVIVGSSNPCTPDKLRNKELIFPYPHDNTKYLKCDLKGRVYVITCPPGLHYHPIRQNCGDDHVTNPKRIMSPKHSNLCTYDNIRQNLWYFPYPANKLFFVECDVWGRAWVVPCPPQTEWVSSVSRCVSNIKTTPSSLLNPCRLGEIAKGRVYYPYPHNSHRYIHCDDNANPWVQFCPPKKVFDMTSKICVSSGST